MTTSTQKPLTAFIVKELGEDSDGNPRNKWVEIGVAFPLQNQPGGFTILLDALPTEGKIIVLPPKDDQ